MSWLEMCLEHEVGSTSGCWLGSPECRTVPVWGSDELSIATLSELDRMRAIELPTHRGYMMLLLRGSLSMEQRAALIDDWLPKLVGGAPKIGGPRGGQRSTPRTPGRIVPTQPDDAQPSAASPPSR